MQLTEDELKLIVAALAYMTRNVRDDSNLRPSEKEKVYKVAEAIRNKFHNAIFYGRNVTILTPDGALNPDGENIDPRKIFS